MTKLTKTVAIICVVVGIVIVAIAINRHRDARMDAYAEANNCTWHYDYYANKQPLCK